MCVLDTDLTGVYSMYCRSSIAQWQSIRLLTGGLQVRVLLEEPSYAPVAQWQSGRLITDWSGVRCTPGAPSKWPHGQVVKTPTFQGGDTGSIPVGATISFLEYMSVNLCANSLRKKPLGATRLAVQSPYRFTALIRYLDEPKYRVMAPTKVPWKI